MAATFQFLHARDLIWSRNTRRYLLGEEESSNDLMSWNADTTRLPERMHSEYLDTLFLNDDLVEGHYQVAGNPVALMNLKMPLMVVGTVRDHVSPWKSVYKIHLYTDTDTTFILASGGHNAGIVSEPGHAKRNYQLHRVPQGHDWIDADEWSETAAHHEGSWWEAWSAWLNEQSSQPIPAREIDEKSVLCDAPGEYVMVRYAD
jgi:polyhydroxyalkanoate synthase